jgi:hypothetical protein
MRIKGIIYITTPISISRLSSIIVHKGMVLLHTVGDRYPPGPLKE